MVYQGMPFAGFWLIDLRMLVESLRTVLRPRGSMPCDEASVARGWNSGTMVEVRRFLVAKRGLAGVRAAEEDIEDAGSERRGAVPGSTWRAECDGYCKLSTFEKAVTSLTGREEVEPKLVVADVKSLSKFD